MKKGYSIHNIVNVRNVEIIEVNNYKNSNQVLNFAWVNYAVYLNIRDENTVGVWKIKWKTL